MVRIIWSDTTVLLLIEKVQMHPIIWNTTLPVYKNRYAKHIIWKKIVEDINNEDVGDLPFTSGELIKKWNSMKSYFMQEVIKVQKMAKSGDGTEKTEYLKNGWKFFQNMLFLKETTEPISSINNLNMQQFDESAPKIFDISDASAKQVQNNLKITTTDIKMKTPDNAIKKEILTDPLDTFEDINQWCICGNILFNLVNRSYLIECIICKNSFCDNEIFMKHVHKNHSDIFIEDLKQEIEIKNMSIADDSKPYYANPEFENKLQDNKLDINTSNYEEMSSNKENFDKISKIEKDSQLDINDSTAQFKTKNIEFTSESTSLKISSLNKKVEENKEKKNKSLKQKYNSSVLMDGIPDSLSIPTNGSYQCTQCPNKYIQLTFLRHHFWLKHTYQFKLNDENCIPDIPESCPNPVDNYYHCTACLGRFTTYKSLMTHFVFHPGAKLIKNKPLKCSYCNLTFFTVRKLNYHKVVHTRKRLFVCEICSKGFIRKVDLVNHVRIHNNDRRYKCNFCDYSCYTNYAREQHELIHSNLKPYVCEICGVAYRVKYRLVMHMRRHTGEKQGKCNICEKSFYDSGRLVNHMLVHSNEKKYQCKICEKKFKLRPHLKNHEKLHSEDKNYICKICNIGFKQNAGLYIHMKCVHGQSKSAKAEIE